MLAVIATGSEEKAASYASHRQVFYYMPRSAAGNVLDPRANSGLRLWLVNEGRKLRRLADFKTGGGKTNPRSLLWAILPLGLILVLAGCQSDEPGLVGTEPGKPQKTVTAAGRDAAGDSVFAIGFTEEGNPFKGNLNADVVIEEFSSYQCPYCGRYFRETYSDVMHRYVETGQVLYVFRDFPLSGQPQSPKAAESAQCAGEVGGAQAYWDMHDRLFEGQGEWSGRSRATEIFKDYASELGLDATAFANCLDSGRAAEPVQIDAREGATRGVRGTPTFFINGQPLVGAQPINSFAAVIDRALAGESGSPSVADGEVSPSAGDTVSDPKPLVPTPVVFDFAAGVGDGTQYALGDPKAPVIIVEFSDYQCPFCFRYWQQIWPTLKERYIDTGRVYYVFRDFPISSIHPQAPKAHEAARCAGALAGEEMYWQVHDRLFEGQLEWAENPEHVAVFKGYAAELGLDTKTFDACLDSGRFAAAVQADLDEGLKLGVNGTPAFFIAGYPFSGAQPMEFFDQVITMAENGQLRDAIAQSIARAQAQQQQQQPRPTMAPADVPVGDAAAKGDPDAPVTIVEYSDYQCPFCLRHFQDTMPQLLENYVETGKVRYVFKDFPLTSIHPQAPKAHEAARCARETGGDETYWQMHDRLFAGQSAWSENPEHVVVFKSYARELGLDQASFDECLDANRFAAAVQADFQEGAGFGVSGTPAFFINGQPLQGAQPYEVFVRVVEALLADQ